MGTATFTVTDWHIHAAGAAGGQRIRGGVSRKHLASTIGGDGTESLVDGNVGGVSHRPGQRRRLAPLNGLRLHGEAVDACGLGLGQEARRRDGWRRSFLCRGGGRRRRRRSWRFLLASRRHRSAASRRRQPQCAVLADSFAFLEVGLLKFSATSVRAKSVRAIRALGSRGA